MTGDIKQLTERRAFVPFTVVTSSGQTYLAPIPDHVSNPNGTRVIVYIDDDSQLPISPLHITALQVIPAPLADGNSP